MTDEKTFVEQAEYIPRDEFIGLSSDHPNEESILRKLTQSGAKLITGPRGCGKTTLILKAYYKLLDSDSSTFPVYVNFKTSLKLEPNYKDSSNGTYWFVHWMYTKIYLGLYKSIKDSNNELLSTDLIGEEELNKALESMELGHTDSLVLNKVDLSITKIQDDISLLLSKLGKKRCVIFFDDAAHAFSSDQQRDFFDLFRKIKNKDISPKAAIYPGVTNFSPTFNVGHDAEQINVWLNPEEDNYLVFMKSLLEKRLPESVFSSFLNDNNFLDIICYSAFGIPRQLLNIVRNLYTTKNKKLVVSFDRKNIISEIQASYKSTVDVFTSLEDKIPTYKNYVSEGLAVYDRILEQIYNYNKDKSNARRAITIAIRREINPDLKKILGFYQYAGLIAKRDQVNKGDKGAFERFIVNISALIEKNAILTTSRFTGEQLAIALRSRNAHDFTRTSSDNLLTTGLKGITLTLPPCQFCNTERINENARFCHNCGKQLKQASVYKRLVEDDISKLKLTQTRVSSIKNNSSIRTIKDIISDIGHTELRSVPQVGEFWAGKIMQLSEEYIS